MVRGRDLYRGTASCNYRPGEGHLHNFRGGNFIQVVNPEVFLPCEVIVSFSTDGKNFVEAKREEYKVSKEKPVCFGNFGWTGCASTRYVRYQARSDKDLRGWLFTDEIIVK